MLYRYIYIGGLMGYILYIYPKKLQFSAIGQFFLVISMIHTIHVIFFSK